MRYQRDRNEPKNLMLTRRSRQRIFFSGQSAIYAREMAHPETDRAVKVYYPIEDNPNASNCEPAPLTAKSASLTATNHVVANNSWRSLTSNSPIAAPQALKEKGDFHDKDSARENPTEFTRGDALDSAKSHSSATSSSMDGVFLTAPETPTESVDHDVRPHELFDSSSGMHNGVEGLTGESAYKHPVTAK